MTAGFAFVALAALPLPSPAHAGSCARFGDIVTLSGTYAPASPPNADGVKRLPATDAGRIADLLRLSSPLCVNGDDISGGIAGAMTIQLDCPALSAGARDAIKLTGRLVGAHSGNGHPPVLLACTS